MSYSKALHKSGFTIVELLIVIVIIAILSVIGVLAYNGVQNRANDATVQSDLRNFVTNATIKYEGGDITSYPLGNDGELDAIRYKFSRGSFDTDTGALLYCVNDTRTLIAIYGRSKSGVQFYRASDGRTGTTTTAFGSFGSLCSTLTGQTSSVYARYGRSSGVWNSWTQ